MNIEKMREEFEAAYTKRLRDAGFESVIEFRRHEDGYANLFTDGAWWGWQASRAAIEVDLPASWTVPIGLAKVISYAGTLDAIESLGLKVKP